METLVAESVVGRQRGKVEGGLFSDRVKLPWGWSAMLELREEEEDEEPLGAGPRRVGKSSRGEARSG